MLAKYIHCPILHLPCYAIAAVAAAGEYSDDVEESLLRVNFCGAHFERSTTLFRNKATPLLLQINYPPNLLLFYPRAFHGIFWPMIYSINLISNEKQFPTKTQNTAIKLSPRKKEDRIVDVISAIFFRFLFPSD